MFATLTLPAGSELTGHYRAPTVRVRSADDVRTALRLAREQAVTLDGTAMDRVLRLDEAQGIIEVQAATPWSELARYLAGRKAEIGAFAGMARLPATIGDAVSQASAGPDGLPVSAHVTAVTLFTADGELRKADRYGQAELFRAVLGGHGAIGVLYSVTLSVESLVRSAAERVEPVELEVADAEIRHVPECAIECLVPPAQLDAYVRRAREILEERRIGLTGILVRRYLPDAYAGLRWAPQEWAGVEIRFERKSTLGACVAAAEVRRALLHAALELGGSFPIGDLRDATRRQLETCYPMVAGFIADKRRSDPGERLQNAWYRRLVAVMRSEACAVRWSN
jgi:hypothetical protein